ncbi:MAG: D-aminoacylase [Deltaproteobacteria bacterium]|nr:D-aminoacylase [Deltaproteobacteria bacterium]
MRLLFTNARLVDGTGAPAREGSLLVEDDHIAELGETSLSPDEVIDCSGAVLCPGFIDMHSHGDFALPRDRDAAAKVMQGVTTEVVGNCGLGVFPANDVVASFYARLSPMLFGEESGGSDGGTFRDLDAFRARLDDGGASVNTAPLVSHGNVRAHAMGLEERQASPGELRAMEELVDRAHAQGAFGLSTGLVYPPGAYAETDEIIALARVAARHGGIYTTHMRDEGARLIPSFEEALRVGREAKISVQISHHKAGGRFNWGKVKKTLAMLERAREQGMDVHSDVYPYTAGSTVLSAMFLPLWAFEGSQEKLLERLGDPVMRARMTRDAEERFMRFVHLPGILDRIFPKRLILPWVLRELSKVVVVSSTKNEHRYEGMSIADIVKERGKPLFEVLFDLLKEEELAVAAIAHVMSEDDVRTVMKHPSTMIGTDGFPQREGKPHPRTYGTYPRVLEEYVKKERLFSLETAIHKMTAMPASKLGLSDRGVLREGAIADLVVLRPSDVHDRSSYADPRQHPDGIAHVMVGGVFTVKNGAHTGARPGRVLSRTISARTRGERVEGRS